MRKMISLGLILGSALALATVAVAAPAGQDGGMGRHFHGHGHDMGFRKLDLTDAQRASSSRGRHGLDR